MFIKIKSMNPLISNYINVPFLIIQFKYTHYVLRNTVHNTPRTSSII